MAGVNGKRVPCPKACGECCYRPGYPWAKPYRPDLMCKHWSGSRGCTLPESQRPQVCLEFLCVDMQKELV